MPTNTRYLPGRPRLRYIDKYALFTQAPVPGDILAMVILTSNVDLLKSKNRNARRNWTEIAQNLRRKLTQIEERSKMERLSYKYLYGDDRPFLAERSSSRPLLSSRRPYVVRFFVLAEFGGRRFGAASLRFFPFKRCRGHERRIFGTQEKIRVR